MDCEVSCDVAKLHALALCCQECVTHIGGQDRTVYNSVDKHLLSMGSFFRFSRRIAILSLRITLPPKLTARKERQERYGQPSHSKCV